MKLSNKLLDFIADIISRIFILLLFPLLFVYAGIKYMKEYLERL